MKKELVVKDNALINASYSLNLVEQRLILLAIVMLREHTHNMELDYLAFNKPIKVTADSYINTFGVSQSTAYETLKDACKTLFARQFSYQEPRERGRIANKTTRWVSDIAYIDNSATVEFTFAPAVLPLILHLEKHLTSYELEQVAHLTSGYAVRLYELLIAWRSVGKTPEIKLNEFRQKMGVLDGEYQRMELFKDSDFKSKDNRKPLADRMRPESLDDFVGQEHLLGKDKLLRVLIEKRGIPSIILWGPSGVGKTTIGWIIGKETGLPFVPMSAVSIGLKEVKR